MKALEVVYKFLNGRFGKKKLKDPYRMYWQIIMWILVIWMLVHFVLVPILGVWSAAVIRLNHLFWG